MQGDPWKGYCNAKDIDFVVDGHAGERMLFAALGTRPRHRSAEFAVRCFQKLPWRVSNE